VTPTLPLPLASLLALVLWPTSELRAAPHADPVPTSSQSVAAAAPGRPRVLFFTHSAGFVHPVVARSDAAAPSLAERAFAAAAASEFEVVLSQDVADLSPARLAGLDALVFFTTGELPLPEGGREALLDFVRTGGAFVGIHCATDTFYEYPPYQEMVGGIFDGHPWHQQVAALVLQPGHPACAALPARWELRDEIYQFRGQVLEPLRVVLALDGSSVDLGQARRPEGPHALAWWRDYGEGRVFYTALGHEAALWEDPRYLGHLLGGLRWALAGPDLPAPVPAGALSLLGSGDGLLEGARAAWVKRDGGDCAWTEVDGALQPTPGAGDIISRAVFGDALVHVEFCTPLEADDQVGQARGNSGVYLQGRYEVQVLDSFGLPPSGDGCGAVYGVAPPSQAACRPPGRWQSYDLRFRAARFDASGLRVEPARLSVWHNGLLVHDDLELPGPTRAGMQDELARGPLLLQDHGDAVRYRNVWVLPTDG